MATKKDAIACIKKAAYEKLQEGEIEHTVGVTTSVAGKKLFKELTKVNSKADFVGFAQVHYDEDILLYFEVSRGKKVTPRLVEEIALVDFMYDAPEEDEPKKSNLLRLGIPEKEIDGFHI